MKRVLGVLVVGLLVAGTTRADGLPPKGMKRVTVDHKITTEKEYPDYNFYTSVGGGRTFTYVKFDPKTPIEIPGAKRSPGIGRQGSLYAVPKGVEGYYANEQAFIDALTRGAVPEAIRAKANFDSTTSVKDTDTRTTVVYEWKVEKLDAKDGFVLKSPFRDAAAPPKDGKGGNDAPEDFEDDDAALAYTPKNGVWVAGLAAAFGIVFAGLWLARRGR